MEFTTEQTLITSKSSKFFLHLLSVCILAFGLVLAGCEGSAGPQGEQGPQGPEGPVGPAGDGSMMYSDTGAPPSDMGSEGDYYLNESTGELYGPKDGDGWGSPGIVLMGEDGADGSQIHSGTGAPASSQGQEGDYYLNTDSYELYGPKTGSGWGSPLNLKGADGNANVTRYLFSGFGFASGTDVLLSTRSVPNIDSEAEMMNSAWLVYGVRTSSGDNYYRKLPYSYTNSTGSVSYDIAHSYDSGDNEVVFSISGVKEGSDPLSDDFTGVEIVRIEASAIVSLSKVGAGGASIIPDRLDVSDYETVAEYYGFGMY